MSHLTFNKRSIAGMLAFLFVHAVHAAQITQGKVTVRQETFTLVGDSVVIGMEINLDGTEISSQSYVLLTPVLRTDSVSKELPAVQIDGKNRHKAEERLRALGKRSKKVRLSINLADKVSPRTYLYKESIPYEPWMADAEFLLREDQCECSGALIPLSFELLAKKMTGKDEKPQIVVAYTAPEAEEIMKHCESGKANLNFPVGVSAINPMFGDNTAELQRIYVLINRVQDAPDAAITGISITGYASPEGESNFNLSLSGRRVSALAQHLKKIYGFPDSLFTLKAMGEDWHTLDRLVEQSTIAKKQQLLDIIRSGDNNDKKGKGLKEMADSVPYRRVLKSLFPPLRRCDIEIVYTVGSFTVEEGKGGDQVPPTSLPLNE